MSDDCRDDNNNDRLDEKPPDRPCSPYLVVHPDDLVEGRRYAIRYRDDIGFGERFSTGVFRRLMRVKLRLVVVLEYQPDESAGFTRPVKEHLWWKSITRIEELEQS